MEVALIFILPVIVLVIAVLMLDFFTWAFWKAFELLNGLIGGDR